MSRFRFKTKEEFERDGLWIDNPFSRTGYPNGWNPDGDMNEYLGQDIPDEYVHACLAKRGFSMSFWTFSSKDYVDKYIMSSMESILHTSEDGIKIKTQKEVVVKL